MKVQGMQTTTLLVKYTNLATCFQINRHDGRQVLADKLLQQFQFESSNDQAQGEINNVNSSVRICC